MDLEIERRNTIISNMIDLVNFIMKKSFGKEVNKANLIEHSFFLHDEIDVLINNINLETELKKHGEYWETFFDNNKIIEQYLNKKIFANFKIKEENKKEIANLIRLEYYWESIAEFSYLQNCHIILGNFFNLNFLKF
jgi:hypothetical protein